MYDGLFLNAPIRMSAYETTKLLFLGKLIQIEEYLSKDGTQRMCLLRFKILDHASQGLN